LSLRVGILCHDSVGGSARVAVELSSALARRGHEVHLFARRRPPGLGARAQGIHVHALREAHRELNLMPALDVSWPRRETDALVRRVVSVARSVRLDVLHCHYAVPFASVAARAARHLGGSAPALVATLHGTDVSLFEHDAAARARLTSTLARFDVLTTVSSSHAALATRTLRLAETPLVIPNFVDLSRFAPESRLRPSAGRRRRVLHVSNFRSVKNPLAMARIFRAVRGQVDAELWLVGDGEGMPGVSALLERSRLGGDVRRFGLRVDVERILPYGDVLLVTSHAESFCLAALEAAACGVPTVAPNVGGLPETVLHGQTGELYEAGDEAGAADALTRLLVDGELRRGMGRAAARHAHRLSATAVVPHYERLYRDVLEGRRGAPDLEALPAA
jgi:N-acetyl-alpha-D-glucosaminyl L-malate synthase BshA